MYVLYFEVMLKSNIRLCVCEIKKCTRTDPTGQKEWSETESKQGGGFFQALSEERPTASDWKTLIYCILHVELNIETQRTETCGYLLI